MLVIDASCLFEIVADTKRAEPVRRRVADDPDHAAPHLVDAEVLGVIRRFHLTGHLDATAADQVAADSPLGRALLGQRAGSHVAVDAPEGRRVMTILSVEPYRASRS